MNKGLLILLAGVFLFFTGITTLHVVCMAFPGDPYCASNTVAQTQSNLQEVNIGGLHLGGCTSCCVDDTCPEPINPCENGQILVHGVCDYPESCANGAYNYPECTSCPHPYEMIDGLCQENVIEGGVCGDGVLNTGEDCEPSIFSTYSYNKRQCKTSTLIGDVTCNSDCTFNSDNCRSCPPGQQITNEGKWHEERGCEPISTDPEDSDDGDSDSGGDGDVSPDLPPPPCEISCPGFSSWASVGKGYGDTFRSMGKTYRRCMTDDKKMKNVGNIQDPTTNETEKRNCYDICKSKALFDAADKAADWKSGTWTGCVSGTRVTTT